MTKNVQSKTEIHNKQPAKNAPAITF